MAWWNAGYSQQEFKYEYDEKGVLISVTNTISDGTRVRTIDYSAKGYPIRISEWEKIGDDRLDTYETVYDEAGEIVKDAYYINSELIEVVDYEWQFFSNKEYIPEDAKRDVPEGYDMLFRLYNPNSGEHFYTTSRKEGNRLVDKGWKYEDIGWYSESKETGKPLYRLYNPNATGAGSHHYTTSTRERDKLEAQGWKYESIAWYGL